MGKLVTVNAGYSAVLLPSVQGLRNFNPGETSVLTDAEYAALTTATTQAITLTTSGLPEPSRPRTDTFAEPSQFVAQFTAATGGTVNVGVNSVTGPAAGVTYSATGFLTVAPDNPATGVVGPKSGSQSTLEIYHTQGAVVSVAPVAKPWIIGATVKWPGGTVPTFTATVGAIDYFQFVTFDGGITWFNNLTVKDLK